MKAVLWTVTGFVAAFLIFAAVREGDPQKEAADRVIEQCWKEYERKSLSPEGKRSIAGFCEEWEAKRRRGDLSFVPTTVKTLPKP